MAALCACSGKSVPAAGPAQSVEEFSMSRAESGATQWTLRASSATIEETGGLAMLTRPSIDIFKKGKPASTVSAATGLLRTQTQDMTLNGNVVVTSREDKSTLRTDTLDYESAKHRFKTDRHVVIDRAEGRMTGKGLVAKDDLSEIQVLHQEARSR